MNMLIGCGELNTDATPIVILSEAKYLIDPSATLRMTCAGFGMTCAGFGMTCAGFGMICARFRMTLVGFRITLTKISIA